MLDEQNAQPNDFAVLRNGPAVGGKGGFSASGWRRFASAAGARLRLRRSGDSSSGCQWQMRRWPPLWIASIGRLLHGSNCGASSAYKGVGRSVRDGMIRPPQSRRIPGCRDSGCRRPHRHLDLGYGRRVFDGRADQLRASAAVRRRRKTVRAQEAC